MNKLLAEETDILPESTDPKMQGLEKFEVLMGSLGLTDRRPVADPVSFQEPDPLGCKLVSGHPDELDMATMISKIPQPFLVLRLARQSCMIRFFAQVQILPHSPPRLTATSREAAWVSRPCFYARLEIA